MSSVAVQIEKVTVFVGGNVKAVSDVTAHLETGNIIGFIGPSGAGKTTLIRSLVGRQKITSGKITIFGQQAGSAQLRNEVSYMTQDISVYGDLTVSQNIAYFASMKSIPRSMLKQTVRKTLETVDLSPHANQLVKTLSGGQKQRVSLAASLIGEPKLLVLDEPTIGLDPVLREQMWKLFQAQAANGSTIIISSHVMDEASRCDKLLFMREGILLAFGSPAEITRDAKAKTLEESFLNLSGAAS